MRPIKEPSTVLQYYFIATLTAADICSGLADARNPFNIDVTHPVQCTRKTKQFDKLTVNYRGTLASDGTEFDSSYGLGNEPITFTLGAGEVIRGWDEGLLEMCIGEKRRLTIPPSLGYGYKEMDKIPKGSTLVFDTELMDIEGFKLEELSDAIEAAPLPVIPESGNFPAVEDAAKKEHTSAEKEEPEKEPKAQGEAGAENGECRLLGPFALLVQAALGGLAVLSLVWKRWRETPRRPLKVWFFDVSKQVVGSVLLHLANVFMSMLSSGNFKVSTRPRAGKFFFQGDQQPQPNPCSFYLLNLAIDTTIGIPILVFFLRLLHYAALVTPLANPPESIKSGNYGQPPRATWWVKQSLLYFLGLVGMKLCVFLIFTLLPWIAWVGDWALRWTEGNTAVQITFVMFIFPLIMNALQYYIIDSFIKDPAGGSGEHQLVPGEDEDSDGEDDEDGDAPDDLSDGYDAKAANQKERLIEANPTPVPVEDGGDNHGNDGEGSNTPSSRGREG